jgi:hypothetical protein
MRGELGHPNTRRGQTEAFGDSEPGLEYFAKKGCTAVDGNYLLSEDWEPINAHYELFMRHDFVYRNGAPSHKGLPIRHFTADELCDDFWTKKGHFTMDRALARIRLAFSLGMDYEFEVKEHMPLHVAKALWDGVERLRAKYPHRKCIVKSLATRSKTAVHDLVPFHRVGFYTLASFHRPFMRVDKALEPHVDGYRGFKPRYV